MVNVLHACGISRTFAFKECHKVQKREHFEGSRFGTEFIEHFETNPIIMNAKSRFIFVFLVSFFAGLLATTLLKAQNGTAKAGIKGGLNVSSLYINNVTGENARLGFHGGLYGQLFSSEYFALQPELLYSTRGSEAVYNGLLNNETVRFNLNYLDLPVVAVIKLGKSAELHAGTYVSYLLNTNITYTGNSGNGAETLDRDKFKSYDYGLVGGFALNFGATSIGIRYNYGLIQIANSNSARNFVGDSKNSCGQLYLAINLNQP